LIEYSGYGYALLGDIVRRVLARLVDARSAA
jgi:hypothetical protein